MTPDQRLDFALGIVFGAALMMAVFLIAGWV
jgi:hypothetical protein